MRAAPRWHTPEALLAAVLLLLLLASVAVAVSGPQAAQAAGARQLQAVTGGLGLGRAVDTLRCGGAFDPRLGETCELRHHPLPGAEWACPDHALPRDALR